MKKHTHEFSGQVGGGGNYDEKRKRGHWRSYITCMVAGCEEIKTVRQLWENITEKEFDRLIDFETSKYCNCAACIRDKRKWKP